MELLPAYRASVSLVWAIPEYVLGMLDVPLMPGLGVMPLLGGLLCKLDGPASVLPVGFFLPMQAHVFGPFHEFEVIRMIVRPVPVLVVNVVPVRDGTVNRLPHQTMQPHAFPLEVMPASVVPFPLELLHRFAQHRHHLNPSLRRTPRPQR